MAVVSRLSKYLRRMQQAVSAIWGFLHPERRLDEAWKRHEEVQQRIAIVRLRHEREGYE